MISFSACKNSKPQNVLKEQMMVEEYYGQQIKDPYRFAEDLEDTLVQEWIAKESEVAKDVLQQIDRSSYLINKQVDHDQKKELVFSKLKITENDRYFYLKRSADENVPRLFYRSSFEANEQLLYDPKAFKPENQTEYVVNYLQPSHDGSKVVVSLTSKGKEVSELIVIDVATQQVGSEILTHAWPSNNSGIHWLPDDSGFIYIHHLVIDPKDPGFLKNTRSVLYRLGNKPNELQTILSKANNPELGIQEEDYPAISIEGNYLIGKKKGARSYYDAYYLPLDQIGTKAWKPLFSKSDKVKSFWVVDDNIYYRTAKNASNFSICRTSVINADFENPEVLVPEFEDKVITDFEVTSNGVFFVTNTNGVKAKLYQLKDKEVTEVVLPQAYGYISIAAKGAKHTDLWINARGWITDNQRFVLKDEVLQDQSFYTTVDAEVLRGIVVKEVEVTAHDGEKVPLSLIYHEDMIKDGKNQLMMDGYGSYGVSMRPNFSMHRLLWVLEGGVYAVAHVRGGGEKGDAWHKGGYKDTKPNTWKDFIACAEYLIAEKYTSPEHLAIWSGSAGGIMIGRAITERPDLFAAATVEFGSLNMLRLEEAPNGASNVKEFGTVKDSIGFNNLLAMDAYHHIKDKEKYPATLLTAGLNDPRVPVWNSVKFTARIQVANTSNRPNFLLVDSETGHAQNDPKRVRFAKVANILSFALWQTGHPDYQPK